MQLLLTVAALLALPGVHANLNQLAQAAGKLYFGTATDNGELNDTSYVAVLSDQTQFGQITPANAQKWGSTEFADGVYNYTQGDQVVAFAQANRQIMRCHNLIWHQQLPTFVSDGSWTNETLAAVIKAHIASAVGHFKGQCYAWDVVNEVVDDNGGYRDSIFYQVMGTSYIPLAFAAAAAADPDAKLYYNDYNIESASRKATDAIAVVQLVQSAGERIDGVGLQAHFIVGETPSRDQLVAQLEVFVALGVEVAYTELDIRHATLPPNASAVEQQAQDYAGVVRACLDVSKCVGVTVWDFDDKYSWVPSTFEGQGDADLWASDLTPKPAYTSVSSVLAAAATPATTTATTVATLTTSVVATSSVRHCRH